MKFRSIFLKTLLASAIVSSAANADCGSAYQDQLAKLNSKIKIGKTELLTSLAGGAAAPLAITITGITLSTVGVASAPALAIPAGAYYAILLLERRSLLQATEVITDAEDGKGTLLKKLVRQIQKKLPNVTSDQVTQTIVDGYTNETFCDVNWITGKVRPFGYLKIKKYIENELGN